MKLIVIDREESWHVADLRRAAGSEHSVIVCSYDQLAAGIRNHRKTDFSIGDHDARQTDAILTRGMSTCSLEQVVFRMDWLAQLQQQGKVFVINPARTIEASVDKYLSLELMRDHGVPVPLTRVSQTVESALRQFHEMNGDAIVKPLFGSGGRRIVRLTDSRAAEKHFTTAVANREVIYQQAFIEHGDSDIRLFTIGRRRVVGMRRHRPGEWIINAQQGAECSAYEPTAQERELALAAASAVGAVISGVDLVYDPSGNPYVVEINACPSWKAISRASGVDIAKAIIQLIENQNPRSNTNCGTTESTWS